jgi:hypothetical protein
MRSTRQALHGLIAAGFIGMLAACGAAGSTGPSAVGNVLAGGTNGGNTPTSTTSSGVVRVRCEARTRRSKISVDGNNLRPLGGTFKATVTSGTTTVSSGFATAVGDEAEFDFDSDPGDIREGAVPIPASFVAAGTRIVGKILDAQNREVASGEVECVAH